MCAKTNILPPASNIKFIIKIDEHLRHNIYLCDTTIMSKMGEQI